MRLTVAGFWIALTALFLASCEQAAIDPSRSLVGARHLPSSKVLSREIIQINNGFGSRSPGLLSYELLPNDTLKVSLTVRENSRDNILAAETFHLSSDVALHARQALWRVRPEVLKGVEWDTYPVGCPSPPTDTFPEFAIAFIDEGPTLNADDDRIGIFAQPSYDICGNQQALDSNNLIGQVLESFPPSRVPAEYERRQKALKGKLHS